MCYLCVRNREMQRVLSSVGSEHLVYTQRVGGSTPSGPTNKGMRSARDASFLLGLFNPKMVPVAANEFLVMVIPGNSISFQFVLAAGKVKFGIGDEEAQNDCYLIIVRSVIFTHRNVSRSIVVALVVVFQGCPIFEIEVSGNVQFFVCKIVCRKDDFYFHALLSVLYNVIVGTDAKKFGGRGRRGSVVAGGSVGKGGGSACIWCFDVGIAAFVAGEFCCFVEHGFQGCCGMEAVKREGVAVYLDGGYVVFS